MYASKRTGIGGNHSCCRWLGRLLCTGRHQGRAAASSPDVGDGRPQGKGGCSRKHPITGVRRYGTAGRLDTPAIITGTLDLKRLSVLVFPLRGEQASQSRFHQKRNRRERARKYILQGEITWPSGGAFSSRFPPGSAPVRVVRSGPLSRCGQFRIWTG